MELRCVSRASARAEEVCSEEAESEFGAVAAAIDDLERIAHERIGGITAAEERELAALWRRLYRLRPSIGADWQWLAKWLARALENGWRREALTPLLKLAEAGHVELGNLAFVNQHTD